LAQQNQQEKNKTTSGQPAVEDAVRIEEAVAVVDPLNALILSLLPVALGKAGMPVVQEVLKRVLPLDPEPAHDLVMQLDRLRKAADRLFSMAQEAVMTR